MVLAVSSPRRTPCLREKPVQGLPPLNQRVAARLEGFCASAAPKGGCGTMKEGIQNMSKQVLVDALKKSGMKTSDASEAVETITGTIAKELKKGMKFSIPGFGTFAVSHRAARMGRNPRTGEEIKIKASKGVRFKAGAKLKGSL